MSHVIVRAVPALADNYAYLVHDVSTAQTAVIDPSDAFPVLEVIDRLQWRVTHVINTHHHHDHVGGNLTIKRRTGCRVVSSRADAHCVPGVDESLEDGDRLAVGALRFRAMEIPGHTLGHMALWLEEERTVFTGDTLFSLGCGRLFEGTPAMMWHSLLKLRGLPPETRVYCGHEYTQKNARFALTIDPRNDALQRRADDVRRLRALGEPTLPSTIGLETATNPFLRADQRAVQESVGMVGSDPVEVFAELRRRKDVF